MSTSIFPLDPPASSSPSREGLPLYREVKWDYSANRPLYRSGAPVITTGADAVMTWAWNALHVKRGLFEALSREYGNDVYKLIGRAYTDALKNAEAIRYVKECLLINPYIQEVKNVTVSFSDSELYIEFTLVTIYGEVSGDGIL